MRPAPIAVLCLLLACGGGDGAKDTTPPVLSVPIVDLSHVKEFLPFGAPLPGSGVLNPAYELRTDSPTLAVVAASPGVVVAVRANDQGDDELEIRPTRNSVYAIIYDHVVGRTVGVGDQVQPGTVLGTIGIWTATEGRTELQVNRQGSPTLAHCPTQFGTAEFNQAHAAAMAATGSLASVCATDTVVP